MADNVHQDRMQESAADLESENSMCIIAVSEAKFSGGETFAKTLAKMCGFVFVNNAVILEKAGAWGGDWDKMLAALAGPPSILDRVTHDTRIQLVLLQAALADEVRAGGVVCYGGAADLLSLEAPHVLRIRVECDHSQRLALAQKSLGLGPWRAEEYLRQCDQAKRRWNSYMYGTSLDASLGYDLRIDLDKTSTEEACTLVRYVIDHNARYTPTEAALALVDNFALTARTKAALATNPSTAHLDLAVAADRHSVSLRGSVRFVEELSLLRSVVESVPGVTAVDLTNVWPGTWEFVLESLPPRSTSEKTATATAPQTAVVPIGAKRLRPIWAMAGVAAAIVLVFSLISIRAGSWARGAWFLGGQRLQSFTGIVTDSDCGAKEHPTRQSAECVRSCVRQTGAKYALWDGAHLFVISDQQAGEQFAARRVVVSGSLDTRAGVVEVHSIDSVPEPSPVL